jgi:hypothetical protein
VLAGCGSQHAIVEGEITVDGQPANSGRVFFRSADEKSVVVAYVQSDGTYHAVDVPLGPMTVWVTPLTRLERGKLQRNAKAKKPNVPEAPEGPEAPILSFVSIPPKYQDPNSSGLTTTVQSGTNTYNIEMASR